MNCSDELLHEWEKTSFAPFEYDTDGTPMFLYACLECGETKLDF